MDAAQTEKLKALAPAIRVEACIADVMARFPADSKDYYVEVHQHLAPLARQLEHRNDELRAEVERLRADLETAVKEAWRANSQLSAIKVAAPAAGTEKDAGRLYRAAPRGIGRDWTPGCMCCGGKQDLYNNASFFVQSRESGEAIVSMFEHGAFLDWRPHEPNWIQVKVGACDAHLENLAALVDGVRQGPKQDGKACISQSIVDAAIAAHTKAREGA